MKKSIACALLVVCGFGAMAACFDYSGSSATRADLDAEPLPATEDAGTTPGSPAPFETSTDGSPGNVVPLPDAGNPCASLSYRGSTPGAVVCPGTDGCECSGGQICCMQKVDALTGACGALGACRTIAVACDGPEDCDGGVCCLEDRSGGGSSCKSGAACPLGRWLCRSDSDCNGAPAGPSCAPLDLGTPGVDDVGLDGIIGVCGK